MGVFSWPKQLNGYRVYVNIAITFGIALVILYHLFGIPYLYYASYSIGVTQAHPTDFISFRAYQQVHEEPQCDITSDQCCIYLGPVIGLTTAHESKFLLELSQAVNLTVILTPIQVNTTYGPYFTPSSTVFPQIAPSISQTLAIDAKVPTIVEFNHLRAETTYTINFAGCQYPLTTQPEGGVGVIRTLPQLFSHRIERPQPFVGVLSCDNIDIFHRDQHELDNESSQYIQNVSDFRHQFIHQNVSQIKQSLQNAHIIDFLSQSNDVWSRLLLTTHQLDYVFHLGDQVYMDSSARGPTHNQYYQAQDMIVSYLNTLFTYKQWLEASIISPSSSSSSSSQFELPVNDIAFLEQRAIFRHQLPHDIPSDETILNSFLTQSFSSRNDAFPHTIQTYQRVGDLVPPSIRQKIYQLYAQRYVTTWSLPSTRHVLSRVSNLFLWDDHDVFDDFGDCAADFDALSLRSVIMDIGLRTYKVYQHALNLPNLQSDDSFAMTSTHTYLHQVPIHESFQLHDKNNNNTLKYQQFNSHNNNNNNNNNNNQPNDAVTPPPQPSPHITTRLLPVPLPVEFQPPHHNETLRSISSGFHHFHILPNGNCFLFIDTRSARHPASFNSGAYLQYLQDPDNIAHPSMLLGRQQWADLEQFLYGPAITQCDALLVANSMPYVFMESSPNYLVAVFHDDMFGHWSSLSFEKEQTRLLSLFTNWRQYQTAWRYDRYQETLQSMTNITTLEQIQSLTTIPITTSHQNKHDIPTPPPPPVISQLLFLGGDVHSSGYTDIYPYSLRNHSLMDAYLIDRTAPGYGGLISSDYSPAVHQFNSQPSSSSSSLRQSSRSLLPNDTIHALTVSPIQNEGLMALWIYTLVGFQHSYPILNDNLHISSFINNGAVHTTLNTFHRLRVFAGHIIEHILLPTLPSPISSCVRFFLSIAFVLYDLTCRIGYLFIFSFHFLADCIGISLSPFAHYHRDMLNTTYIAHNISFASNMTTVTTPSPTTLTSLTEDLFLALSKPFSPNSYPALTKTVASSQIPTLHDEMIHRQRQFGFYPGDVAAYVDVNVQPHVPVPLPPQEHFFFGYNHYNWINTNAFATISMLNPTTSNQFIEPGDSTRQSVCIESQIVSQVNKVNLEEYALLFRQVSSKSQIPLPENASDEDKRSVMLLPTLWAQYAKRNTTGTGCT